MKTRLVLLLIAAVLVASASADAREPAPVLPRIMPPEPKYATDPLDLERPDVSEKCLEHSDGLPTVDMPEGVYDIFARAIRSGPPEALAALERLRTIPWPDMRVLAPVYLSRPSKWGVLRRCCWLYRADADRIILLRPDFTFASQPRDAVSAIEVFDFQAEAVELAEHLGKARTPAFPRKSAGWFWGYTPLPDRLYILNVAYAAACAGDEQTATALIHQMLRARPHLFQDFYTDRALRSLSCGTSMLVHGWPRDQVLAQWKRTLALYPETPYTDELTELIETLEAQMERESTDSPSDTADPAALPVEQQVAYYVAGLPDFQGRTNGSDTYRLIEESSIGKTLVAIGRPALPALINHLDDRRLIRTRYYNTGPGAPALSYSVLRVQDAALFCIERIVGVRFYVHSRHAAQFSQESAELRDALIADITDWWQQYGADSALKGLLGRLDKAQMRDRITALREIDKIETNTVDAIGLLKQWAEAASDRDFVSIAEELARRGDLSLLPKVRELTHMHEACRYLVKHGTIEDYRLLGDVAHKGLKRPPPPGPNRGWQAFGALKQSGDPAVAPILAEFLTHRDVTGTRYLKEERRSVKVSRADSCMLILIRFTGQARGYNIADDMETRYAAIDRWMEWWESEGLAAYIKRYPDAGKLVRQ